MEQIPIHRRGTDESCSYCWKEFAPDYNPARKNVHYVYKVRTKYVTYYGPTHMNCVTKLQELQLPGVTA